MVKAVFIGINLTDRLLEHGAEVIDVDDFFNERLENLDDAFKHNKCEFHEGDIRDLKLWLDVFEETDIIHHQATFTSVR